MTRTGVALLALAMGLVSCGEDSPPQQAAGKQGGVKQGQPPPPPAAQGTILYETDFASFEGGLFGGSPDFGGEHPAGGTYSGQYTDYGALNLSADLPANHELYDLQSIANTGGVFAGERELVDLADVSIQAYGTPLEWETGIGYGLHCREQPGEAGFFYEASIGLDEFSNEALLFRADGPDGFTELGRAPLPPSVKTENRQWNYLQLDCIGDEITFSVNGEELISATDATHASGMAALFTVAYVPQDLGEEHPGASASVDFDDLRITEL